MEAAEQLRAEIRRAAASLSYNQSRLAEALGVSSAYLGDVLRGKKRMTPKLVTEASQVLGMGSVRRRRWHRLGAMESGWEIKP
jgi:transcriptional regulator with XRE-family HTH domain